MVVRLDLLAHVAVLVLYRQGRGAAAVACIDEVGAPSELLLLGLELLGVVVPYYIREVAFLHAPLDAGYVQEAVIASGELRPLPHGQQGVELLGDEYRVLHLVLGIAGMNVASLDVYACRSGVEVLELKLSRLAAVHGVGVVGSELRHVELHHAPSYLLVGGERHADLSVSEFRVAHDILHGVHYLCHSGLVVGSEQRGAVGGYHGLALMRRYLGEILDAQHHARDSRQGDVASVVVLHYLRLHSRAACVWGGVDMRYESYGGNVPFDICGNRGHDIAPFVQLRIHAHGLQFVAEHFQQPELLSGRWLGLAELVGLRVHDYVTEKSVQ